MLLLSLSQNNGDADRKPTDWIISRESLKHSNTRVSFLSDHCKIQFSLFNQRLLKIAESEYLICKERAKDINDISVRCHNHHRFDKRSAFVDNVRLSLKRIFWTFLCKWMYHREGLQCLMPEVPAQISLCDCESLHFVCYGQSTYILERTESS